MWRGNKAVWQWSYTGSCSVVHSLALESILSGIGASCEAETAQKAKAKSFENSLYTATTRIRSESIAKTSGSHPEHLSCGLEFYDSCRLLSCSSSMALDCQATVVPANQVERGR